MTSAVTLVFDGGTVEGGVSGTVTNTGATACDIGGIAVVSGAGYPLAAGASVQVTLRASALYAITASGSTTLAFILG